MSVSSFPVARSIPSIAGTKCSCTYHNDGLENESRAVAATAGWLIEAGWLAVAAASAAATNKERFVL